MNVFVVLAHPEPQSFNAALFHTAVQALGDAGHAVATSDLYAMGFKPVSSRLNFTTTRDPGYLKLQLEEMHATEQDGFAAELEAEMTKVEARDLMIWQFPLWWFGLPAILKGWVDRAFAMGRMYGGGRIYDSGVFRGKRAVLSLTTGGPREAYAPDGFNGDIGGILRPIQRGVLEFVGFDVLAPQITYGPIRLEPAERAARLTDWADRPRSIGTESPIAVGRY